MWFSYPREHKFQSPDQKNPPVDFLPRNREDTRTWMELRSTRPLPYTSPATPAKSYTAAPTRPRTLPRSKRSQRRGKPTRDYPLYLMLPFGGELLFHFRHKHTRYFALHRAQALHGEQARQCGWKAGFRTQPGPGREKSHPSHYSHETCRLRQGGSATSYSTQREAAQYAQKRPWPLCLLGVVVRKPTHLHVLSRGLLPGSNDL